MNEVRDNSGILGENAKKTQPNHPDKKGSCMIDGVEYWISGWSKSGQYGAFDSLAFQRKDAPFGGAPKKKVVNEPNRQPPPIKKFDDFDDDIPF